MAELLFGRNFSLIGGVVASTSCRLEHTIRLYLTDHRLHLSDCLLLDRKQSQAASGTSQSLLAKSRLCAWMYSLGVVKLRNLDILFLAVSRGSPRHIAKSCRSTGGSRRYLGFMCCNHDRLLAQSSPSWGDHGYSASSLLRREYPHRNRSRFTIILDPDFRISHRHSLGHGHELPSRHRHPQRLHVPGTPGYCCVISQHDRQLFNLYWTGYRRDGRSTCQP